MYLKALPLLLLVTALITVLGGCSKTEVVILPDDPLVTEKSDEGYQTESYLKLKQDIAEGNYPSDLSTLNSPEEFKLLMPKLMEDGLITFDRKTGSYNFSEEFKKAMAEKKSKVDEPA